LPPRARDKAHSVTHLDTSIVASHHLIVLVADGALLSNVGHVTELDVVDGVVVDESMRGEERDVVREWTNQRWYSMETTSL
jgi:hypothetical protein